MMEHYTTQATNAHNLWLQGLQELALRQVRARDMSRPQVRDLGKTLHGMWQHFVQGWELIFTPPPHQKNYSGAEAQQNPAEVAPEKEIDHSEFRAASVEVAENNHEIWAPFKGSSEIKRSEEAREKQETHDHSAAGIRGWEHSQLMKYGLEAPILRTELLRDDFILTEKEFPSSEREEKIAPEAPTFIARSQEKESSSIKQNDLSEAPMPTARNEKSERPFIGQDFLPEAPGIKGINEIKERSFSDEAQSNYQMREDLFREDRLLDARKIKGANEGRERPFGDEDWHKEAPETKVRNECTQALIDDDGQPKKVLNKGQGCFSIGQDWQPDTLAFIANFQERERLFDRGHYRESSIYQAEAPTFIAQKEKSEHSFIGQNFSSEALEISPWNKELAFLFNKEDRHSEGTSSTILDQMVEGSFKREDRCPEGNSIDTMHRLNKRSTDPQERFYSKEEGWKHTFSILEKHRPGIRKAHQNEQGQERKSDSFWQSIRLAKNTIQEEKRPQLARDGSQIKPGSWIKERRQGEDHSCQSTQKRSGCKIFLKGWCLSPP